MQLKNEADVKDVQLVAQRKKLAAYEREKIAMNKKIAGYHIDCSCHYYFNIYSIGWRVNLSLKRFLQRGYENGSISSN